MRLMHVIAIAGLLAAAGTAAAGTVNVHLDKEHQGKGNKGAEFRPVDDLGDLSGLVLTALSSINDHSPFDPFASGLEASVYIDNDGAGVQAANGKGSKGISGGGGHKDEQLNFAFDNAALASSIQLGLIQFKAGKGLGKDDDAVLFIHFVGDDEVTVLDETDYLHAYTSTAKDRGYIDFGMLGFGDALIDEFGIRETHGHIELNGASFTMVPLPAPVLLGLAGLIAATCARRRFARTS